MSRKLAVYEPFLEKRHKEKMRAAAEKHGFEVRIVDNPEEEIFRRLPGHPPR